MAILSLDQAPYGGRVRLLPESASAPRISPRLLILHSIVGTAEGAYRYFRDATNLESTFIVTLAGEIWQLMDTTRHADANYRANPFALSVETEDRGDPDSQPWTPEQLAALAWLARECHRVHPAIPLREADRWDGAGIGWHTMFGAPGPWTPVSKTCPGRARIAQFPALLERIQRGGSMATIDQVYARQEGYHRLLVDGDETHPHNLRQVRADIAEVEALVRTQSGGDPAGPAPINVQFSDEQLARLAELAAPAVAAAVADLLAARLQA